MRRLLNWLDNNILKIALITYIFFIPLYPKLPFQMINYTYIAIRIEDFFVGVIYLIFGIQLLRKKVQLNKTYLVFFLLFWISVFISFALGFFVQKTIIIKHLGILHSLRRIEYMAIFFVAVAAIQKKRDLFFFLRFILIVIGIICIYGLGQKYLGWPAVQTMNPEYAKGYVLVLDSWARISSTFGGHYDLAAFLIFFIPLVLALTIQQNAWFFALYLLMLSNLVLTASRVSYVAYVASAFPFLLLNRKFKLFFLAIIATVGMTLLSNNLTTRLKRTFQTKQIFINKTTGQTTVPRRLAPDDLPIGDYVINKKSAVDRAVDVTKNGKTNVDLTTKDAKDAEFVIRADLREEARKSGKVLTKVEEDRLVEDAFRNMKVVTSVLPDISVATRLQVEWPRAVKAFIKYPFFGKGPSSITEATDNDYLRWLGEFGIVGTLLFLAILVKLTVDLWKTMRKDKKNAVLFLGILAGYAGLLVNATYIDVFEASKVAFMFWLTMGFVIGYTSSKKTA